MTSPLWDVYITPGAARALRKMDRQVARRLLADAQKLSTLEEPWTLCKALTGPFTGMWRRRVGDYRMIIGFQHGEMVIAIADMGHRSEIYG